MKILINEGCQIFGAGMKSVLENEGHTVDLANSFSEFNKMMDSSYDIIIFDLDNLKAHAISLANNISTWHTHSFLKSPRLIATYTQNSIVYYQANLFDGGLKKSFNKEKLLSLINKENIYEKGFYYKTNSRCSRNHNNESMVRY